MTAKVLQGSKKEIAERILHMAGDIREVIVVTDDSIPVPFDPPKPGENIFAEMEPYMAHAGNADLSREAIYTRMEGE